MRLCVSVSVSLCLCVCLCCFCCLFVCLFLCFVFAGSFVCLLVRLFDMFRKKSMNRSLPHHSIRNMDENRQGQQTHSFYLPNCQASTCLCSQVVIRTQNSKTITACCCCCSLFCLSFCLSFFLCLSFAISFCRSSYLSVPGLMLVLSIYSLNKKLGSTRDNHYRLNTIGAGSQ